MTQVTIDADLLESLADYVSDDLRHYGGPEMEDLEVAVRAAYEAIDEQEN